MSETAIRFEEVGKMYRIFSSRRENLLDALGFELMSGRDSRDREFWALRGVSFELKRGQRLGIIGRNGAGKSTLLKIVTGNLPQTEGAVVVNGDVQALLEIGGGLHPEFTGYENIDAALSFLGLSKKEIAVAVDDIAEFTELGRFLTQPFKTYSMGMQARLSIGIATTIQPEILIVDEILGAGDAYFFAKSTARMQKLLDSGAAVLLVSHALEQIERFCDETIWLDRGRIAMQGRTTEVIKAYEKFIRELDDRRLQAKNRKTTNYDAFDRESYTDHIGVRITSATGASCEVTRVSLFRDGRIEDEIAVGDAQDGDTGQSSHIQLRASDWSAPQREGDRFFRTVAAPEHPAVGTLIFYLWFFYPDSTYEIEVTYRASADGSASPERAGRTYQVGPLPATEMWSTVRIPLAVQPHEGEETRPARADRKREATDEFAETVVPASAHQEVDTSPGAVTSLSRWSGGGELTVARVALLDENGIEQAVFEVHRRMTVRVDIVARDTGIFPLILAALVFRADGVITTRHVAEPMSLDVREGDRFTARLELDNLLLGNGNYLLSLGLYSRLHLKDIEPSEFYDYFDKSFEFRVVGNPPLHNEIVRHPGRWSIDAPAPSARRPSEATARS
ncbi:MAG: ATP-binding cassette domain-containing protein [Actinobacteria bacterium]|nr:ATP-binding cassette domain-containing protein [Actinomycetota bacterium]